MSPDHLRNLKVDRAEEVLSELHERGYLEVEGDGLWKAEVLTAIMSRASTYVVVPSFTILSIDVPDSVHQCRGGFGPSTDHIDQREPYERHSLCLFVSNS
jgi:hypothetical protein